ncbi:DUF4019 domain-containing protein [Massilia sp. CF038]|uniref:DUF4019 domain-containing protein n=1 Tax=Massilia sp. CF038 TaxID=1881045 RepID=UPI000933352F|nr:DUF4019 domain-containing protein [Massilia sp. CF038]
MAKDADDIGYPTVAAALAALKARSDVKIETAQGWTVVREEATQTIWTFTPPGHPAHPSVIRRAIEQKNGAVYLGMQAKCGAKKNACDKLIAEFTKLNEGIAQSMQSSTGAEPDAWTASAAQLERVTALSHRYFAAKDGKRYEEAYALLAPAQKKVIAFDQFLANSTQFNAKAGAPQARTIKKITWYRNPPNTAPGTYAAVDFDGHSANLRIHCGYTVWVEQADGAFLLVREEENYGDAETLSKVTPQNLPHIRAQLQCRD